jgi:hypothetical protein
MLFTVKSRMMARLATTVVSVLALVSVVATPAYASPRDDVKITDPEIDFGGLLYAFGAPVGSGSLNWNYQTDPSGNDWYWPELDGTLHLEDANGECGRVHLTVWIGSHLASVEHSSALCASDNTHHHMHINLPTGYPINEPTEAHICTEIGPHVAGPWTMMTCQTEYL